MMNLLQKIEKSENFCENDKENIEILAEKYKSKYNEMLKNIQNNFQVIIY